jgi:hypothetical protein
MYVEHVVIFKLNQFQTTRHEKITIVGGTSQRFLVDRPAQILCVPSGSALVDYLVWTKNGNKLESGLETFDEPGLLYFSKFQVNYFSFCS